VLWDPLWSFYCKFTAECAGERIVKIYQYLKSSNDKLVAYIDHPVFIKQLQYILTGAYARGRERRIFDKCT